MRPGPRALALVLLVLGPSPATAQPARLLDAVVAEVGGGAVTASDIALARALRLFDFEPTAAPIAAADVERYIDVRLVLAEARLLDIEPTAAEVEAAWQAAVARAGGRAALEAWLAGTGVDRAWARAAVADDLRRREFIALRFGEFVFHTEEELVAELGAEPDTPEARERARARLAAAAIEASLAVWLAETRARVPLRLLDETPLPAPFPPPGR
jgi:hypothetical protein